MANKPKFNWTGDLEENCECQWGDYHLVAKQGEDDLLGLDFCVASVTYKGHRVLGFQTTTDLIFEARELAEHIAMGHAYKMEMGDGGES